MPLDTFSEHFAAAFPDLTREKVLVALSGGADSVALLHLMHGITPALRVEAAHVHHGIRGDEADQDARFCAELAAALDVPFHLLRIHPPDPAPSGREATWRELRYRALIELKARIGAAALATAHHRDDVAEGVLVQLLRGGGPRALSGIAERTAGGVIRPLLPWSRCELRSWLRCRGLPWCDDSSNLSPDHLRNRVRLELLPHMAELSPSIRDHLVELAGALAAAEDHLADELIAAALWIEPWDPDGGVERSRVASLSPALRARWLHAQAARVGIRRVTRSQSGLFAAMLEDSTPRAVTLERRWVLRLVRGRLWLEPPQKIPPWEIVLAPGETRPLPLPGWQIRVGAAVAGDRRWCHAPRAGRKLSVRSPRPGDRIEGVGRAGDVAAALSRRLPRHLRRAWPVFCEDDRICWIPGVWQPRADVRRGSHVVEVTRRE